MPGAVGRWRALLLSLLIILPACAAISEAAPRSGRPPITVAGAGDICGDCGPTAALLDRVRGLDLVLTFGDNAYSDGLLSEFMEKYHPHWGRFNGIVRPSPGNHDHHTPDAQGYRDYFGLPPGPLYYSFNSGGWHFLAMDTEVIDATQVSWLAADLKADRHTCEVAYGHHPRFSSGSNHGSDTDQDAAWRALATAGVELVLYGHDHLYERFAPMKATGQEAPRGTREFVVGTGGADLYGFGDPLPTSRVRLREHGIIVLKLGDETYSWRFLGTDGKVHDFGSGTCH
jgi:hypothetical protein